MKTVAVILAGGVGSRMASEQPKQFLELNGKPIIVHTIENFEKNERVDKVLIVCVDGWHDYMSDLVRQYDLRKTEWIVPGGETGHDSTTNAIFFLRDHLDEGDYVVIHDAARPILPQMAIDQMLDIAHKHGNASLAIPCYETVIYTDDQISGIEELDRSKLMRVQTPQAYEFSLVRNLYERAYAEDKHDFIYADLVLTYYGVPVFFSKGFTNNIKVTKPEDLPLCESLMKFSDEELFSV